MRSRVVRLVVVALLVSLWLGCGKADPYGRQAVSGKVTLNGQPVVTGSVEFSPTGQSPVRSGAIITNGEYSVPQEKGLPPGEYIVRINAPDPEHKTVSDQPGPKAVIDLAPPDWNTASQHKITVAENGSNEFNFDMTTQ